MEERDLKRRVASGCLNGFIRYMRPDYLMGWVHREICHELDEFLYNIIEKKSPRLIITMPPRSGKSTIISHNFPAYVLGKFPKLSIIATSYSADLAARNNRDVQRIIDSSGYRELFPGSRLAGRNVRTDSQGNWQRNSDIFEIVGSGGSYRSAGIGGGITGMGGECVLEGTTISTPGGLRAIESLRVGDEVYSYNLERREVEKSEVEGKFGGESEERVKFYTPYGTSLEMTRTHKVWVNGEWVEAGELRPGQALRKLDKHGYTQVQTVDSVGKRVGLRRVYDIQVSGNNNYFANGFLVHNCLIIDDPVKNREEADSLTLREKVWDWYTSTFYTRLAPGGGIVIIQTRWHMDDLVGRLLEMKAQGEGDDWRVINFPAVAERDEEFRKMGEALHPERYDLEQLMRIKRTVGLRDWSALYQQQPIPDGGQIFRKEWINYWTTAPRSFDRLILSWDMAFKSNLDSDFVVGQVWGKKGGDYYLMDQARGRWSFTETVEVFKRLANRWPGAVEKLVEDKANGPAVMDYLKRKVSGIIAVTPEGGKTSRAYAITPVWESGNVYIPSAGVCPWSVDFELELLQFPAAANDDQVDAMTQALNRLLNKDRSLEIVSTGPRMTADVSWGGMMLS
jgi:predicted phage terminase large subunit-like protein